jgi:hypothetical protein
VQRDQIFIRPGARRSVRRTVALYQAGGVSKRTERVVLVLGLMLTYVSMVWLLYGFSAELPLSRQLVALATASASALLLEWLSRVYLWRTVKRRLVYQVKRGNVLRFDPSVFAYWKVRLGAKKQRKHTDASLKWLETNRYDALCDLYEASRVPGWQPQEAQEWFGTYIDQFLHALSTGPSSAGTEHNDDTAYAV